jgi:hypothetical protein
MLGAVDLHLRLATLIQPAYYNPADRSNYIFHQNGVGFAVRYGSRWPKREVDLVRRHAGVIKLAIQGKYAIERCISARALKV